MKSDLIWVWVCIVFTLLTVFYTVVNCVNANWVNLPICCFALGLNIMNTINHFREYKRRKAWQTSWHAFDLAFRECWPDEPESSIDD